MPRTVISPKKGIIMDKNQLGSFDPNAFSIEMQSNEVRNKILEFSTLLKSSTRKKALHLL